jgi:DNA-binding PucR family transcriptional regulator
MLGALLQAAAERADLIHTLDVFLDTGNSHKQTARLLGIHPKTLKYRLERIEEILGGDVWRAEQRLSLHLAVKLARLNR